MTDGRRGGAPWVSVVVPVYNAAEYLDECLGSVRDQTIGFDRVEVVAVDDGSTDGSGPLLDGWAARHPNVTVIHQPNSGAPGGPRNRGAAAATGEFLFFADPDDYLGPEAFARMLEVARRAGTDVVLGRVRGVGRRAAGGPFKRGGVLESGDIHATGAVWSMTAHKLFRRAFVEEHGLRFAEGARLAEEQRFVLPAYLLARGISVVADYDCYHLVQRDGFAHLTGQRHDPAAFYALVGEALATVERHTGPGRLREDLLLRWAKVELTGHFGAGSADWDAARRAECARLAGALLERYVPGRVTDRLDAAGRVRAHLLRAGRTADLAEWARLVGGRSTASMRVAAGRPGRRGVRGEVLVDVHVPDCLRGGPEGLRVRPVLVAARGRREIELRDAGAAVSAAVVAAGAADWSVRLRVGFEGARSGSLDLGLRQDPPGVRRVVWGGGRVRAVWFAGARVRARGLRAALRRVRLRRVRERLRWWRGERAA